MYTLLSTSQSCSTQRVRIHVPPKQTPPWSRVCVYLVSSTATRTADAAGTSGEPKTIGCARLKLLSGRGSLLPETHFYIPSPILTTLPGRRKNAEQALQRPTKILRNPPYALGAMERAVVPTVTTAKLHRPERRTKGFSQRHAERERASNAAPRPPSPCVTHGTDPETGSVSSCVSNNTVFG